MWLLALSRILSKTNSTTKLLFVDPLCSLSLIYSTFSTIHSRARSPSLSRSRSRSRFRYRSHSGGCSRDLLLTWNQVFTCSWFNWSILAMRIRSEAVRYLFLAKRHSRLASCQSLNMVLVRWRFSSTWLDCLIGFTRFVAV